MRAERQQSLLILRAKYNSPLSVVLSELFLKDTNILQSVVPPSFQLARHESISRGKCGAPHLVREICTLRSMSGDGKRGVAAWPKLP